MLGTRVGRPSHAERYWNHATLGTSSTDLLADPLAAASAVTERTTGAPDTGRAGRLTFWVASSPDEMEP